MKNLEPLVSVNITTYNRSKLLQRCINSIISQTYRNMEIIIIDDCSSDNTDKIAQKYIDKDSRIKYIKNKTNQGLAKSRNIGVANSKGEYIATMDDDDEWIDKNKILKQVDIFKNNIKKNIAVVCSGINVITENNKIIPRIFMPPNKDNYKNWIKYKILKGNGIIHTSTVLTKKEIILKVGGFDENLTRGIDSDFYRRCILIHNYFIYFMNEITTNYSEYGSDRITNLDNAKSLKNNINANIYLIKKYFKFYIAKPSLLLHRIKIIKNSYKQLKNLHERK